MSSWQLLQYSLFNPIRLQGAFDKTRSTTHVTFTPRASSAASNTRKTTFLKPNRNEEDNIPIDDWYDTDHPTEIKSVYEELLDHVHDIAQMASKRGRSHGHVLIEILGQRPIQSTGHSLVGRVTAASHVDEWQQYLTQMMTSAIHQQVSDLDEPTLIQRALQQLQRTAQSVTIISLMGVTGSIAVTVSILPWVVAPWWWLTGASIVIASGCTSAASWTIVPIRIATQYAIPWRTVANDLDQALTAVHDQALEDFDRRLRDGVSPYTMNI